MLVIAMRLLSLIALAAAVLVTGRDLMARGFDTANPLATLTSVRDLLADLGWANVKPVLEGWLPQDWKSIAAILDAPAKLEVPAAAVLAAGALFLWIMKRLARGRHQRGADPATETPTAATAQPRRSGSDLKDALRSCRMAFVATALFSALHNMLLLTGSMFMLEVYDRVLPSRSVPTLIGLCAIALILFIAMALLDLVRNRLLTRIGGALDDAVAGRVFDALVQAPLRAGNKADGLQPLRDLDAIRSFLGSNGPTAIFDLPWLPFYLAIIFAFHPWLGVTALCGAIVLISLTLATELLVRQPIRDSAIQNSTRIGLAEASVRNSEVLFAMGFGHRLRRLWLDSNSAALASHRRANDVSGGLGAWARAMRMVLQSAVLAVGAYLVIQQQASAGIIIAGSILSARALAPVDTAISNWRGFVAARQSWQRLGQLLSRMPVKAAPMALEAPVSKLQIDKLMIAPPGQNRLVVHDVSFAANRGQAVAVIGPSGSGKSCLARAIVGAWLPSHGSIRLDGASLDQWAPEALGQHIGYLPQDVELFAGTVAQNIARFDPVPNSEAVIKAARAADIHDLIVTMPKGYDTEIGHAGAILSAGQRQRLALARALFGDPFLVVLDEPDASLDQEGEQSLRRAIQAVRARNGIVIVVSHRQAMLGSVDLVLAMQQGQVLAFGPRDAVLQRLSRPPSGGAVHILKSIADHSTTGPLDGLPPRQPQPSTN